jgi:hypothetical protein
MILLNAKRNASKYELQLGMMVQYLGNRAEGLWVQGHPGLHGEFQASLGYIARTFYKTNKNPQQQQKQYISYKCWNKEKKETSQIYILIPSKEWNKVRRKSARLIFLKYHLNFSL